MRKILSLIIILLLISPAYSADDDSTPYMPYTEPPQNSQPENKAPAKKAPAKKSAPKKSAPKKSTSSKKTTSTTKKKAPAKPSSLQMAIDLINQDRLEAAKPYLLKAIQQNRNDPNVWYWYGVYHEKIGAYHQAQYYYTKALKIDPTFDPLSRVVYYPEDENKTPLWDPKRPARVYPVETASVPPNVSNIPQAPNDPQVPGVPVYTPPEPGSSPLDGDSWRPAVYVPPSPEETQTEGEMSPVYVPPQPAGVVAQNPQNQPQRQTVQVPMSQPRNNQGGTIIQRDIQAVNPVYNPPEPPESEKVKEAPKPQPEPEKKQVMTTPKRQSTTVPKNRIVKQDTKKQTTKKQSTTTKKSTPKKTQSADVKPSQPAQRQQRQQQTPPPPVQQRQPEREYLPPVGQYTPDPGTISETPIPPVGQGNND